MAASDPTPDPATAALAEIRERWSKVEYVGLKPEVVPEPGDQPAWLPDVDRLLAALDRAMEPHRPGPVTILGVLCERHENYRHFSITRTEIDDVRACPDCPATVYTSCAGCGRQVSMDACRVREAITSELAKTKGTDHD